MNYDDVQSVKEIYWKGEATRLRELLRRAQTYIIHADYCKQAWYAKCDCDCGAYELQNELAEELAQK